ncbi:type I-E CRISPR-associated protein Cas6/Cse3/CasE [Nitrincola iocasae]|uniref:Type I-E CRISPR-associated protein Cas6/Cse3/CasE n=1 Tax=Nitrincola iocasae TaxID=2614693 RepID=A0A5J6LA03_9GAMM|nr:type I-E CRISPR-associated protein Cas6/Cse3/CasE [Nitrincola iocasae]
MLLHRIHLDPRCKEVRRDLADYYQLHSTLCRAFSKADKKCPPGEFLWRHEPETNAKGLPQILILSKNLPDWSGIGIKGWLNSVDPAIDLKEKLQLQQLSPGQRFRFRLRANPSVTRKGKRFGLMQASEQESWLEKKSHLHGFQLQELPSFALTESENCRLDVCIVEERVLRGKQHSGNSITIFSVLFEGVLSVTEPEKFIQTLGSGIGHAKAMGQGMLSIIPV